MLPLALLLCLGHPTQGLQVNQTVRSPDDVAPYVVIHRPTRTATPTWGPRR